MRALGLDPSLTSFGWCVYDSSAPTGPRKLVASGHEGTLNDLVPVARFMHARSLVESLLRRYKVDVVGIESPAYDGGPFQTAHFGLMMFAMEPVFERRKDLVLFDPTTLKFVSAGKSDASKADMQKAVQLDRMSPDLVQSDESDAYLVAKNAARFKMLWAGELSPDDLTPLEQRVFLQRMRQPSKSSKRPAKRVAHVFRQNSRFFELSKVPPGSVTLPQKSDIPPELLRFLEEKT